MCGIVSYVSKWRTGGFMASQQKIFDQMLYAGALRGVDATGVIAIMQDGDFSIAKEASASYMFSGQYHDSPLDKEVYKRGAALIGHNRAKTIGGDTDDNAHPFVEDKTFAMVHNGTLRNHKSLHDTVVDSHALTILFKQAMDADNWEKSLEVALGKVDGAFATGWYDQKRNTINFIRNGERPLSMITSGSGWVFCSEASMGVWILQRNNEKIDKIESLDVHTLYSLELKARGEWRKTFLSPKFRQKGYSNGTTNSNTTTARGAMTNIHTLGKPNDRPLGEIPDVTGKEQLLDPVGEDARTPLSKNAFKKLRGTLLNQELSFWVDDYIDIVNDNQGHCQTAMVLGSSLDGAFDLCEMRHSIKTTVGLKDVGLRESDFYGAVEMTGKVYEVEFNKERQEAVIRVNNPKLKGVSGEIVH